MALKAITIIVLCVIWSGCGSMLPSTKTKTSSVQATEKIASNQTLAVQKVVEGERTPVINTPPVNVSGQSNSVSIQFSQPPQSTNGYRESVSANAGLDSDAGSTSSEQSFTKVKVPLWVSLVGFSVGLIALLFALKMWRNSSVAARTIMDTGDRGLASLLDHVAAVARSSTDSKAVADLNSITAMGEKLRGKINSI